MSVNFDNYLGIHANALALRERRASHLANNLANVDTPNYKAKDIDFQAALQQAQDTAGSLSTTSAGHFQSENGVNEHLKYRVPLHNTLDGNTVDKEMEISEYSKNSMYYQASLSFLDGKIKSMMSAIRGD